MPATQDVLLYLGFAGIALLIVWAIRTGRGLKEISLTGIGKVVFGEAPKSPESPGLPPGPITPEPRRYSPIHLPIGAALPPFQPVPVLLPHELMSPAGNYSLNLFSFSHPAGCIRLPEIQEAIDDMGDYARIGGTTIFDLHSMVWGPAPAPDKPLDLLEPRCQTAMRVRRRFTWSDGRPACVIEVWFPDSRDLREPRPYNAVFSQQHGWISPE